MRQTYRRYGFMVSAAIHLGLLGGVAWLLVTGMSPGPQAQEREVPVALSMFAPPAGLAARPAETEPDPAPPPPPPPSEEKPAPEEPVEQPQAPPPPAPSFASQAAAPKPPPPVPVSPQVVPQTPRTRPQPPREIPPAPTAETIPQPVAGSAGGPPMAHGEAPAEPGREAVRAAYLARLQVAISRHRYYPRLSRRRREEGRVLLQLLISADGSFAEIRVAQSSGSWRLDDAAVKTIERVGRAEPLPDELGLSAWRISVPMVFSLK